MEAHDRLAAIPETAIVFMTTMTFPSCRLDFGLFSGHPRYEQVLLALIYTYMDLRNTYILYPGGGHSFAISSPPCISVFSPLCVVNTLRPKRARPSKGDLKKM
jgi:hypothetical protein